MKVEPYSGQSFIELKSLYFCFSVFINTRLCFPRCYAINTIRSISSSTRPQDLPSGEGCINTPVYRDPIMSRKDCAAVPEGNCPILQQEEFGSSEPTLADIYRLCEEIFDRMDSYFDRRDIKLDEISD